MIVRYSTHHRSLVVLQLDSLWCENYTVWCVLINWAVRSTLRKTLGCTIIDAPIAMNYLLLLFVPASDLCAQLLTLASLSLPVPAPLVRTNPTSSAYMISTAMRIYSCDGQHTLLCCVVLCCVV